MKNHGRKCLKSNKLPMHGNEPRSEQRVECVYCDLTLRKEVTVYQGCGAWNRFRTIPTGFNLE